MEAYPNLKPWKPGQSGNLNERVELFLKVACFLGSRFTISKASRTFHWDTKTEFEANAGRDHVVAALKGAKEVLGS
jgi:hypothetical protein